MNSQFSEIQYCLGMYKEITNGSRFGLQGPKPLYCPSLQEVSMLGYDLALRSIFSKSNLSRLS